MEEMTWQALRGLTRFRPYLKVRLFDEVEADAFRRLGRLVADDGNHESGVDGDVRVRVVRLAEPVLAGGSLRASTRPRSEHDLP